MASSVDEIFVSRSVLLNNGKPTMDRKYTIRGVDTEQAALNALVGSSLCPESLSLTFGGNNFTVPRQRLEIREVSSVRREGDSSPAKDHIWEASARYTVEGTGSSTEWTDPPEIRWSFSFYTESFLQKVAFDATRYGNSGPNCGDKINVVLRNGENIVEGVSVMVPFGILRGTKTYANSQWANVINNAKSRICKVNSTSFSAGGVTFLAGELLMTGAEARQNSQGGVDVEYQFLYSPNSSGSMDGISYQKSGWDVLWAYFEKTMDYDVGLSMPKAASVYVDRVYDTASFSGIF